MFPLVGAVARVVLPTLGKGLAIGATRASSIIGTGIKTLSKKTPITNKTEVRQPKQNIKEKILELPKFKSLVTADKEKSETYKEWKESQAETEDTKDKSPMNKLVSLIKQNTNRVNLLGNILAKVDEHNNENAYSQRIADRDNRIMITGMFARVYSKMSELKKSTGTIIGSLVEKAKEKSGGLLDMIGKGLGIGMLAYYFWPAIKEMFSSAFEYLKAKGPDIAANIWTSIKEQFNRLMTFLVDKGPGIISSVYETVKNVLRTVVDFLIENGPNIIASITKGILQLGVNIISFIIENGPKIISSVMSGVFTLGRDIISGIFEYVPKLTDMLWNTLSDVISSIGSFIKDKIIELVPGASTAAKIYDKAKNFLTGTDEAKIIESTNNYNGPVVNYKTQAANRHSVTSGKDNAYKLAKPSINLDGIQPSVMKNFVAMSDEYKNATGKSITVTSGYRSIEEQEKLYRTMPKGMAAKPGSSLHNFGWAMDISSKDAEELEKTGLLQKYGFHRPLLHKGETWHIEPKVATQNAAKIRSGYNFTEEDNKIDYPKDLALEGTPDNLLKDLKEPDLASITSPMLSSNLDLSTSDMAISSPIKLSPSEFMSRFEEGLKLGGNEPNKVTSVEVKPSNRAVQIDSRTKDLASKTVVQNSTTIIKEPTVHTNTIMKEAERPQTIALKDISFESSKLALVGNLI
jgi:hypothetical protein